MTGQRDERLRHAPDTARRQAEGGATAEILALEEELEEERRRATRSLEAVQRRLQEAEARAGASLTIIDTRERDDSELRRLQAESEDSIRDALAKVEADTRSQTEQRAELRLAERESGGPPRGARAGACSRDPGDGAPGDRGAVWPSSKGAAGGSPRSTPEAAPRREWLAARAVGGSSSGKGRADLLRRELKGAERQAARGDRARGFRGAQARRGDCSAAAESDAELEEAPRGLRTGASQCRAGGRGASSRFTRETSAPGGDAICGAEADRRPRTSCARRQSAVRSPRKPSSARRRSARSPLRESSREAAERERLRRPSRSSARSYPEAQKTDEHRLRHRSASARPVAPGGRGGSCQRRAQRATERVAGGEGNCGRGRRARIM